MNIESKRRRRESDEVIAQHSLPTVTNWRRLLSERLATLPIWRPNLRFNLDRYVDPGTRAQGLTNSVLTTDQENLFGIAIAP
jgi:hypothetical protein